MSTTPGVTFVTVRYFAGARAASGVEEEDVPAVAPLALATLTGELEERHGPALAAVLGAATFLVDGVATPRDAAVAPGATVDVLPPFAGG